MKLAVPTAVVLAVVTVKVLEVEPLAIEVGLKAGVAPVGRPVVPRPIAPVNPLKRPAVTLYVVDALALSSLESGNKVIRYAGLVFTMTVPVVV